MSLHSTLYNFHFSFLNVSYIFHAVGHGENPIRGSDVLVKNWRADIATQKHMKQQVAPQTPDVGAIVYLQSGINFVWLFELIYGCSICI